MSSKPDLSAHAVAAATAGPPAGQACVYMLRIWFGAPPRPGFQALVRPVESAQWLGFTSADDLLAYLLRHDHLSNEDKS